MIICFTEAKTETVSVNISEGKNIQELGTKKKLYSIVNCGAVS